MDPSQPGLLLRGNGRIAFEAWPNSTTERFYYGNAASPWRGCAMKSHACMAVTGRGVGCSRVIVAGFHYCWQHLQSLSHLSISPTSLINQTTGNYFDFLGLFCCQQSASSQWGRFPDKRIYRQHVWRSSKSRTV